MHDVSGSLSSWSTWYEDIGRPGEAFGPDGRREGSAEGRLHLSPRPGLCTRSGEVREMELHENDR